MKFKPTTHFDLNNALLLAHASNEVYKTGDAVKNGMNAVWDVTEFQFIEHEDTQCFVGADGGSIILAFRGTTTIEDWLTNAKIRKVEGPLGDTRVHYGFQKALDCVWGAVESAVAALLPKRLWITGHSLGGALAALATARFLENDIPVEALYTFGQPRVGNSNFAEVFEVWFDSMYRLVNNEDIVPRVPVGGYKHVGREYYFDNDGILHEDPNWIKKYSDHVMSVEIRSVEKFREVRHKYPNSIADHGMSRYIHNIEKSIGREKPIETFKDYLDTM